MKRFILLSFVFLGLGFYELSGGADFDPAANRTAQIEARQDRNATRLAALPATTASTDVIVAATSASTQPEETTPQVTRAALNLVSFETVTQPANAPNELVKTERSAAAISELATEQELSLAALESAPTVGQSVAFAGNSRTASSVEATLDIRTVKGTLVNMRSGPGTDYDVVDQLSQSTRVEILTDSGNGWVELRPLDGGATGWIAEFLLTGG